MELLEQLAVSFLASASFVVIFNAQKSSLLPGGVTGMASWLIYFMMAVEDDYDPVAASAVASFFVAVISQLFSRRYKTPVTVFIIAGIIPLVPGGLAYDAMRNFVENDYYTGVALAAKTLLISGAIAFGLVFSEVINQMIRRGRLSLRGKDGFHSGREPGWRQKEQGPG
ncbi:MAG: threonine/serine exporter family protein [Bacillales bacterium]